MAGRVGQPQAKPLILIANAEDAFARSVASVLSTHDYRVVRAYTAPQALDAVRLTHPDAILLDIGLPELGGFATCRALRAETDVTFATPIILTTPGSATRQERLDALRAGAWDLRSGPLDPEEFLLTLGAYVRAKLETDRIGAAGLVDHPSGLYNREGLERRAREIASQAQRQGFPVSCVALKLQGEPQDHVTGDDIAQALHASGRISDAIARVGKAEFAVFAPATDDAQAELLVTRLSSSVERALPGAGSRLRWARVAAPPPTATPPDPVELVNRAVGMLRTS
jgi:PleD family two-component response regulator